MKNEPVGTSLQAQLAVLLHRAQVRARIFFKHTLSWNRVYRTTSYLNSALWVAPLIAIFFLVLLLPFLRRLDLWLGWGVSGLDLAGMQSLCQTLIALTSSFLVFTFGSLLVAIQVAGAQLTPRVIATTLLSDRVVRYSVSLFVFTLILSISELNRLQGQVPQLLALLTIVCGIAVIADFLFLIDYAARLLRPVTVLARVGNTGLDVIYSVYPQAGQAVHVDDELRRRTAAVPSRVLKHVGRSEILLAVDLPNIVELAKKSDGMIELLPQVGDFVAADEPLFLLYGGAMHIDDDELRAMVATGGERTMEQDPMFAFRIIVDIALKALSPAINDPTTAVLALDQIHRLLRVLGKRSLRGEVISDNFAIPRVIFRTPNWEDFVRVGCQEIRTCGISSVQIPRRLRAMLNNLIDILPEHRHAVMREELDLLDRMIVTHYSLPEDLALARIPDSQGLGGAAQRQTPLAQS